MSFVSSSTSVDPRVGSNLPANMGTIPSEAGSTGGILNDVNDVGPNPSVWIGYVSTSEPSFYSVQDVRDYFGSVFNELRSQNTSLTEKTDNFFAVVASMQAQYESLRTTLTDQLSVLTEKCKMYAKNIFTLEQEKTTLIDQLSEANTKVGQTAEQVSVLRKENVTLADQVSALTEKCKEFAKKVLGLEQGNEKLMGQLSEAQAEAEQTLVLRGEKATLTGRVGDLEQQHAALASKMEALSKQASIDTQEIGDLQHQLQLVETQRQIIEALPWICLGVGVGHTWCAWSNYQKDKEWRKQNTTFYITSAFSVAAYVAGGALYYRKGT